MFAAIPENKFALCSFAYHIIISSLFIFFTQMILYGDIWEQFSGYLNLANVPKTMPQLDALDDCPS